MYLSLTGGSRLLFLTTNKTLHCVQLPKILFGTLLTISLPFRAIGRILLAISNASFEEPISQLTMQSEYLVFA
jgi:hypothetical protein